MRLIPSLGTYSQDYLAQRVWSLFEHALKEVEGIAYYKHPIIRSHSGEPPDLLVAPHGYQPVAVKVLPYRLDEIVTVRDDHWLVGNTIIDSPVLQIDDFTTGLSNKLQSQRALRGLYTAIAAIALPNVSRFEFERRFGPLSCPTIWQDGDISQALVRLTRAPSHDQWRMTEAVIQGMTPLAKPVVFTPVTADKMGGAIALLEREIAVLDSSQDACAVQIPPGPQRIRGLAGTGKTVLLAKKCANIHERFPEAKVLFTFNTHSLYNQAKKLVRDFYQANSDSEPNWENIHILHGWGGRARPGVYSELSLRQGVSPLTYRDVKSGNRDPFAMCCESALTRPIEPVYDFILVDEAQDFPAEFFRVLFELARPPKAIYWAYDELQTLSSVKMPSLAELFGSNPDGSPRIESLEGEYDGGIEKDLVLQRSYRCPRDVLMLAHAIGLGLYSPRGVVQMLADQGSWNSVGYEVEAGALTAGEAVTLFRPEENSPNRVATLYTGNEPLVELQNFTTREHELAWVASSVHHMITAEAVRPESVVVVSLNSSTAKAELSELQRLLMGRGVRSIIPGLVDESWEFAEPGRVTLSTVFRAKGNEAAVVYVMNMDLMATFSNEIEARNKAFTAISRAKGWVRLSGSGRFMAGVEEELRKIVDDIPRFRFVFPNMDKIRSLDAETTKRRKEVGKAKKSVESLLSLDPRALAELDPAQLAELRRLLNGSIDREQD